MERSEIKRIIEAILFVYTTGVTIEKIKRILRERFKVNLNERDINEILQELSEEYKKRNSAICIVFSLGKWKMTIDRKLQEKFLEEMIPEIPKSHLKVLALVLNKYPIKQSEIVKILGNRAYQYIKELVNMGFLKAKKEGRTIILEPTPFFFKYFEIEKKEGG